MKRKLFLLNFVLMITMFLVSCSGNGGPIPPITTNQSPTASFTANPTSGIAPLGVSFNASNSSDSDGSIISYAWNFKDGDTGTGETINHTFSSIGSYNVELTVTDNEGTTDSITKTITVTETSNQSPTASFTANPASGVAPLEVSFNASNSSDSDGSIVSYTWDFKDGYTGNGVTVNHTFNSTGSYNVGLTITDNEGATDSITKTITVTEIPSSPIIHSFTADQAIITEGENTTLSWQVTDATTVTIDQGVGSVALSGSTSVYPAVTTTYTLTAINSAGSSTATVTITVIPAIVEQPLVIESFIISDFNGLNYGNIYELANGQIWQQTEYYIWYWYWFYPGVLIWNDGGIYRMKVEGIDHPVMVKRIN